MGGVEGRGEKKSKNFEWHVPSSTHDRDWYLRWEKQNWKNNSRYGVTKKKNRRKTEVRGVEKKKTDVEKSRCHRCFLSKSCLFIERRKTNFFKWKWGLGGVLFKYYVPWCDRCGTIRDREQSFRGRVWRPCGRPARISFHWAPESCNWLQSIGHLIDRLFLEDSRRISRGGNYYIDLYSFYRLVCAS